MPPPRGITAAKQLLVEGKDAEVFLGALLKHMELTGIQIQNFGGKDELRGFLKALCVASGFVDVISLAIVRDAEIDPGATFQSICDGLRAADLPIPERTMVQVEGRPQVSIMILPDATTEGMLETLCLRSVRDDPAMKCVERYFECLEQQVGSRPSNMDKARLQAFLSSRARPGLLLGQAAHRGYWPWGSPVFDQVKQFLQQI